MFFHSQLKILRSSKLQLHACLRCFSVRPELTPEKKGKKKGNTGQMWATEIRTSISALVSYNAACDVTADKHGDLKQMVARNRRK